MGKYFLLNIYYANYFSGCDQMMSRFEGEGAIFNKGQTTEVFVHLPFFK